MTVAARMNDLGTESAFEVLAKARALESQGKEIIHLEIGEPDFETPRHIVEAGMQAISDGRSSCNLNDFSDAISSIDCKRKESEHNGPDSLYR